MDFIKEIGKRFNVKTPTYQKQAKLDREIKPKESKGTVKLGQTWRAQKKADIPFLPSFLSIRVSKGKSSIGTQLSPFNILVKGDVAAVSPVALELYWQAAKVTPDEVEGDHVLPSYYERRHKIYTKGKVKRRYIAKGKPIAGAVFNNDPKIWQWIESREIY